MTLREYLYRENIIPTDPELNVVKETSFIHSSFVFVFYDFDLSSEIIDTEELFA